MPHDNCENCGEGFPVRIFEYYQRIDRDGCPACNRRLKYPDDNVVSKETANANQ